MTPPDDAVHSTSLRFRGLWFMDRYLIVTVVSVVGLFASWAIGTSIRSLDTTEHDVVVYSTPQRIERIVANPETVSTPGVGSGSIVEPRVDGYSGPAVCIGDTVPVRGSVEVFSDSPVETAGSLVWEQIPPGPRFQVLSDIPSVQPPGPRQLQFENPIPPAVVEMTLASGEASQWRITGRVDVFQAHALPATWTTALFWVVDC